MNFMSGSRLRPLLAILLISSFAILYSTPIWAATRTAPARTSSTGADYIRALAAADRFLQAWQSEDVETGTVLLSSHVKDKINRDELDRLFTNSAPGAYEIEHGKLLHRGCYEFPIVLLNGSPKKMQRHFSNIIMLNTGHNDWAVDKLP
jgi:hypothetical protein